VGPATHSSANGALSIPRQNLWYRLPERPVDASLTELERQQRSLEWNQTAAEFPPDLCVQRLFEAQVERTPDKVAVVFEGEQLTYRELNSRANQLAHYLRLLGVKPDSLVGICLERGVGLVTGILGILKAGGAYVPLDPCYPAGRLKFMLQDSQAQVLLTESQLLYSLPPTPVPVICVDADRALIDREPDWNPQCTTSGGNLAYVIYTSGSTGQPKGVQIEHRSLVNFLFSMAREPGLHEQDVLLAVTTLSFDIAALEVFLPLTTGARLVVIRRQDAVDGRRLSMELVRNGATVMQATPATWRLLIESGWQGSKHLKILCGGEALARDLADQLAKRCGELWNMYGPSETTIWSTVCRIERLTTAISIGRPIANTQAYVLDHLQQPVPLGETGELYLGGAGLARGYLNRPELTAEKFVEDRFGAQPQGRLYRTGDLARWRPDGNLECLGRIDQQIKIRGFRIEPGEIEALLRQHPRVRQAAVVLRECSPGDQRLVAYIVPASQLAMPSADELRAFLGDKLPEFMVPSAVVTMPALPLTPNGKVDRRALPLPSQLTQELPADFIPPRNELEERMCVLWAHVLHMNRVGIHDNFCHLGGHSLLMAQLIARIRSEMNCELAVRDVFDSPTVAELAALVDRRRGAAAHFDGPTAASNFNNPAAGQVDVLPRSLDSRSGKKMAERRVHRKPDEYLEVIRSGEAGAVPVVCVGDMRFNGSILRRLPKSVPVYFLKLDGCHVWPPAFMDLDDQTNLYVRALAAQTDQRKALLVGFSYGGFLASHLATELLKRGWADAKVLLFEPEVPNRYLPFWARMRAGLRRIRRRLRSADELSELREYPELAEHLARSPENDISNPEVTWNIMVGHYERVAERARLDSLRRKIAMFGSVNYHERFGKCWDRIEAGGVDRYVFTGTDDHLACFCEPFIAQWLPVLESCHGELSISACSRP
jgi:amino acid adenylation domain-containing protein